MTAIGLYVGYRKQNRKERLDKENRSAKLFTSTFVEDEFGTDSIHLGTFDTKLDPQIKEVEVDEEDSVKEVVLDYGIQELCGDTSTDDFN